MYKEYFIIFNLLSINLGNSLWGQKWCASPLPFNVQDTMKEDAIFFLAIHIASVEPVSKKVTVN